MSRIYSIFNLLILMLDVSEILLCLYKLDNDKERIPFLTVSLLVYAMF